MEYFFSSLSDDLEVVADVISALFVGLSSNSTYLFSPLSCADKIT